MSEGALSVKNGCGGLATTAHVGLVGMAMDEMALGGGMSLFGFVWQFGGIFLSGKETGNGVAAHIGIVGRKGHAIGIKWLIFLLVLPPIQSRV